MSTTPPCIRLAAPADLEPLRAFDELHVVTPELLAAGEIFVCIDPEGVPIAYAHFDYTFFWKGWVATLVVHPGHRRRGHAAALLAYLESICKTRKIFISTSIRNLAMQGVLARSGYQLTGVIDNLGPTPEPELFYFKLIEAGRSPAASQK